MGASMDSKISKLLALLFCIVASITLSAQEISVSSFRPLPEDMTARTLAPERDVNGELTALIKVVTIESGFVFEGGSLGIAKAEQKEGEWWVYVPDGARKITIRHPRLGILRNYAYPVAITAGGVYEMRLVHGVVETVIKEREILSEFVVIESDPSGADVYLNGEAVGKTPFSSEKPEGNYEWRVEKNLYQPQAGRFDLYAGEKVTMDLTLVPDFGGIEVTTIPEDGATILFNGIDMARSTPATLERLPKGQHTLTVSHEWYETTTRQVNVTAGEIQQLTIEMKPTYAQVNINASSDEEVFVNGVSKGYGNWSGRLAPGVYDVELRREYHAPAKKQLNLKSGDVETLDLNLEPIISSVKIQSTPMGAEVYLNGELKGTTPQIIRELMVGEYELTLKKSGYGDVTKTIEVKEGETAEYFQDMESSGSIRFETNISGAEIYVNGDYKGITPITVEEVNPGTARYELKKSGYDTVTGSVEVRAGEMSSVSKSLQEQPGTLSVSSSINGASVYVDGSYKGVTPLTVSGLQPGSHKVQLQKSGYSTEYRNVTIRSGQVYSLSVSMSQTKAARTSHQRSAVYWMYDFEVGRPLGMSFGSLNKDGVGIYWNVQTHPSILTFSLYDIDDAGNSDSPWELERTGEIREGYFASSLGLTFKVAYPFWLYTGAGYRFTRYLVQVEEYGFATGDFYGTEWYENTDRSVSGIFWQAGVMLRAGDALVLRYGILPSLEEGEGVDHSFGLGFQF